MSLALLYGLGAPLVTILLIVKWLLHHFAPANPATICGCRHDFAFHNLGEGTCHGSTEYRAASCSCQQFTGKTA